MTVIKEYSSTLACYCTLQGCRHTLYVAFRLAHALASSFNFQGRVLKTFYVLTDDKVGAGPRLRPQSLNKDSDKDQGTSSKESNVATEASQPMETDAVESAGSQPVADAPAGSAVRTLFL